MPKKVNKETKKYKVKELRKLKNKCLKLWSLVVKHRAGFKCEWFDCEETKNLNSHHVEGFLTNQNLRFNERNGLCLCPLNHKFGRESAHRSFCFVFLLMAKKRRSDFEFLLKNWNKPTEEITKEYLLQKIEEFEKIINS